MLKDILRKTIGGLDGAYYFRHFFFGLLLCGVFISLDFLSKNPKINLPVVAWLLVLLFLYPFSRFVYESIVNFIFGDNVFFVNGIFFIMTKLFTMLICFIFAPIISLIGFIYLYYYHTKNKTFE